MLKYLDASRLFRSSFCLAKRNKDVFPPCSVQTAVQINYILLSYFQISLIYFCLDEDPTTVYVSFMSEDERGRDFNPIVYKFFLITVIANHKF